MLKHPFFKSPGDDASPPYPKNYLCPEDQVVCPHCGKVNSVYDDICVQCGRPLEPTPDQLDWRMMAEQVVEDYGPPDWENDPEYPVEE